MNRFSMSKYTIIYENLSREYYSLKLFNISIIQTFHRLFGGNTLVVNS